jgi:hypothetical protein
MSAAAATLGGSLAAMNSGLSRPRTRFLQSGMFNPRNAADERDELLPALLLRTKLFSTLRRQAVVAAAERIC